MRIDLDHLTKKYGKMKALDDVTLKIEPGQTLALVGSNGAGKTTLLRCLSGIVTPKSGDVLYDGEIFRRDRLDMRKRFMFLPDFPAVFGALKPQAHIGMMLRLYGKTDITVRERVMELMRGLDLQTCIGTPLAKLSRGQIYKTALTALLAIDPEVWLLDEPFASGMDPTGITMFKREVRSATERGRTVIYSTQILDVAENLSDRVAVIERGQLKVCAPMQELRAQSSTPGSVLEQIFEKMREERQ